MATTLKNKKCKIYGFLGNLDFLTNQKETWMIINVHILKHICKSETIFKEYRKLEGNYGENIMNWGCIQWAMHCECEIFRETLVFQIRAWNFFKPHLWITPSKRKTKHKSWLLCI